MKVLVKAKAGAKRTEVVRIVAEASGQIALVVSVKEPATEGKANRAILKEVAKYFKVPQSQVSLVRGSTSSHKVIEVAE